MDGTGPCLIFCPNSARCVPWPFESLRTSIDFMGTLGNEGALKPLQGLSCRMALSGRERHRDVSTGDAARAGDKEEAVARWRPFFPPALGLYSARLPLPPSPEPGSPGSRGTPAAVGMDWGGVLLLQLGTPLFSETAPKRKGRTEQAYPMGDPALVAYFPFPEEKPKGHLQNTLQRTLNTGMEYSKESLLNNDLAESHSMTSDMPSVSAFFSLAALAEVAAMENVHRNQRTAPLPCDGQPKEMSQAPVLISCADQ
ncbi:HMG box transcription factor BBX [Crotalus adamanteus]|uniref:HMG box transcription factor BBX n=1 Tax=Crotalus adamanteus TaxID=8729 RepID=A0AAW1BJ31_CROAD